MPPEQSMPQPKKRNPYWEISKFVFAVLIIVTPVRWFIAQPFLVSGASMVPTIDANEYLVVDKVSYHFHEPERGDIVIFQYPLDTSIYFIKRVIGLPGETVIVHNGGVVVRGVDGSVRQLNEKYVVNAENMKKEMSTTTLAADEFFLMGDNRDASSDSRSWGPLPRKYMIGRALVSLYPLKDFGLFPGKENP